MTTSLPTIIHFIDSSTYCSITTTFPSALILIFAIVKSYKTRLSALENTCKNLS